MSEKKPSSLNSKFAWRELPRKDLPKRSAAERAADFLEIYGSYDEATAREQASRCIQCPEPACVFGCPLASRIPEWIQLTAEGRFLEAAAVFHSTSVLPEICARVCPSDRTCEGTCILNETAEPVSIRSIERFLNEYAFAHGLAETAAPPPNGLRVAVAGSGAAGLACADELSRRGYAVTVFDSALLPGGLLLNGIPAFVLEKTVIQHRIERLQKRGVVFRMGVTLGENPSLKQLQSKFDAVFLGVDAQKARPLNVPGADLAGVIQALPFMILKNTNMPLNGPPIDVAGKRVVVLGGGDTAMDCLRTALRCGAREVICVYRRDEANMPCSRSELENAREEGAQFLFRAVPVAVLNNGQGRVGGLRLIHTALGEKDASGRQPFIPQPGTEFDMEADWILLALGFDPVPFPPGSDFNALAVNQEGGLVVDDNQMTSVTGVFAGGDIVLGPSHVLDVVRDARKAAAAIHRHLSART